MSDYHEKINRRYLMNRKFVKKVIQAYSAVMDQMKATGHGLESLLHLRNTAQDREQWNERFDAFFERWSAAFEKGRVGGHPINADMRNAGLQCLAGIQNDLRNDMWTDKKMQSDPPLAWFGRLFWTQVHQKMIYTPVMIACGVSREIAIRMTKFSTARREILDAVRKIEHRAVARGETIPPSWRAPETSEAMFEAIAVHIGEPWASVEKIGRELPMFLRARGSDVRSVQFLDEIDYVDAEWELAAHDETLSSMLFDLLPVGSVSALDEVGPDVQSVIDGHCKPELKRQNAALFEALVIWQKKTDGNEEQPAPEEQVEAQHALRLLRACIEREFRNRLGKPCGENDD